jgi:hypothetical protein
MSIIELLLFLFIGVPACWAFMWFICSLIGGGEHN